MARGSKTHRGGRLPAGLRERTLRDFYAAGGRPSQLRAPEHPAAYRRLPSLAQMAPQEIGVDLASAYEGGCTTAWMLCHPEGRLECWASPEDAAEEWELLHLYNAQPSCSHFAVTPGCASRSWAAYWGQEPFWRGRDARIHRGAPSLVVRSLADQKNYSLGAYRSACFTPTGKELVAVSESGGAIVGWSLRSGAPVSLAKPRLAQFKEQVVELTFPGNPDLLVCRTPKRLMLFFKLLEHPGLSPARSICGNSAYGNISAHALASSGHALAIGYESGALELHVCAAADWGGARERIEERRFPAVLEGGRPSQLALSADGKLLAVVSDRRRLFLFDEHGQRLELPSSEVERQFDIEPSVRQAAFASGGALLYALDESGKQLHAWRLSGARQDSPPALPRPGAKLPARRGRPAPAPRAF